eukprot:m.258759 g.258759  ORF g.258759 m.258759 type:complete len:190 (+) comp37039_c0_seq1:193-762(+)
MDEAKNLLHKRTEIERKITSLVAYLNESGVGEKEPLIDSAGFPRADVDVHGIRIARHELARLRTDLITTNSDAEKALLSVHGETTQIWTQPPVKFPERIPFAAVGEVLKGSPADEAGLIEGDQVLLFGPIDHTAYSEDTSAVDKLVRPSEGVNIRVMLKNSEGKMRLTRLCPKKWSGPGLLGCRIVKLD